MRFITSGATPCNTRRTWHCISCDAPVSPRGLPSFDVNLAFTASQNAFKPLACSLRCRRRVKNFFKVVGGPHSEYCSAIRDRRRACRPLRARRRCGRGPGRHRCLRRRHGGSPADPASGDSRLPRSSPCRSRPPPRRRASWSRPPWARPRRRSTRLTGMTYAAWLDEQFAKPQSLHRLYINQAAADLTSVGQQLSNTNFWDSWWSQALGARRPAPPARRPSPCREILVISFADATLRNQTRGVASYYDMLGEKAFGNFRDLLEGVTYHPMMGIYLSHLKQPEGRPGHRPRSRPELRARDHAAVLGRPVQAQRRRHQHHGRRRPPGRRLHLGRPRGPVAGLHRPQLVRGPAAHRPHRRPLQGRQRPTSSATGGRCRRTTSTRRTPASTRSARRSSSARRSRR